MKKMNRDFVCALCLKIARIIFLFPLLHMQLHAQNVYYVSPSGSAVNIGSISNPWNIQYALNGAQAAGKINAGDTIYLRSGTYTGKFISNLGYAAGAPIIVKNYNKERVIINGYTGAINNATALVINGLNTWFMGLEVTSTSTSRVSGSTPSGNTSKPGDIYTGGGVDVFGQDIKIINFIVHDIPGTAIGAWKTADNNEIYGCILYNNGFSGRSDPAAASSVKGHGPGIYVQNLNPAKPQKLLNNFVFKNFSLGIEAKTTGALPGHALNGINIDSNTIFNAGALNYDTISRKYNLFLGSEVNPYNPAENIYIRSNVFYRDETDGSKPFYQDGILKPAHYNQQNISFGTGQIDSFVYFHNNYITGSCYSGGIYVQNNFKRFDFQYNTLYDPLGSSISALVGVEYFAEYNVADTVKLAGTWNNNRYFSNSLNPFWREKNQTQLAVLNLAGFRSVYGTDINSVLFAAKPTDTAFIRKNKYETNTFYVTVLNNSKQAAFTISFGNSNLNGYYYTVIDAQNYFGSPVTTGIYNGTSIVLPMNLQDVSPAVGNVPVQPNHTSANLGTFIIRFTSTLQPLPCNPPTGLTVSNTSTTNLKLNWTAANQATRYVIQKLNGTSWDSIGFTTAGITTFTAIGLQAYTSYSFRVGTRCAGSTTLRYSNIGKSPGKYFIDVNGSATNAGTITQPWTLAYALGGAGGAIKAGDSLFLKGGIYTGNFSATFLNGTAALPIVFRNFNGEIATIDGYTGKNTLAALTISSFASYTTFAGLEIKCSSPSRLSLLAGDIYTGKGVDIQGSNIKLVNCIIHDMPGDGIYAGKDAVNTEIYGCIIYNNGYERALTGYSNGITVQNSDQAAPKTIANSFIFKNNVTGILAYGNTSSVSVNGISIDSSTVFNTGALLTSTLGRKYNLLVGGASNSYPAKNINVRNNVFYRDETDGAGGLKPYNLRYNISFGQSGITDSSLLFQGNYVVGGGYYGAIYVQSAYKQYNLRNNTFYTPDINNKLLSVKPGTTLPGAWSNNSYSSANAGPFSGLTFPGWKTAYMVDANSNYSTTKPTDTFFIRQNKYDTAVYYVTVLNHSKTNSFNLPFVNHGLTGRTYIVQDVQNYFGNAVATGIYGGVSISLPMNLAALSVPSGTVGVLPLHTSTNLGTFIIKFSDAVTGGKGTKYKTLPRSEAVILIDKYSPSIKLFPNPAYSYVSFEISSIEFEGTNKHYQIINEAGAVMATGVLISGSTTINTHNFAAGFYSIRILSGYKLVATKTFIKE